MNIKDLIAETGIAERQLRFLIAEGFVPPPRGGRAYAEYGEDHVAAIRRYGALKDIGFPPAAIRILLQTRSGVPFPVAQGISLVVDPDVVGSGVSVEPIVEKIHRLLADLIKEPKHGDKNND
jgi:DNA-binding transcriptional MerR regulator